MVLHLVLGFGIIKEMVQHLPLQNRQIQIEKLRRKRVYAVINELSKYASK